MTTGYHTGIYRGMSLTAAYEVDEDGFAHVGSVRLVDSDKDILKILDDSITYEIEESIYKWIARVDAERSDKANWARTRAHGLDVEDV